MLIKNDMGVIAEVADRVMVMYQGRVLEDGPVGDVMSRPRAPYTGLMAAVPSAHQRLSRLPVPEATLASRLRVGPPLASWGNLGPAN